ncbi:MAG: glycosyltransferase family 2 protein [Chloroflexota bacterium]
MVTLVVAMRNEEATIEACLGSILAQTYPRDQLEVLVYDGASTDGSWDLAARALGDRPRSGLHLNARRTQAVAWNLGIDAARGEVIGIVSGHARLAADYVEAAVDVLRTTGADMVGGPVRAVGDGTIARAIALAMSHPFGVGGATFRYLDREQDVDTVFMGLGPSDVYRRFKFDEEMVRNQDDELSYRLQDASGRIVCSPRIKSVYQSRSTFRGLWRQYFAYGFWKVRVLQKHPAQARLRHLVPTTFVLTLAGGVVAAAVWPAGWIGVSAVLVAYGAAMGRAIWGVRTRGAAGVIALLPVAFVILHCSYGLGMVAGLVRHRRWEAGSRSLLVRQLVRRARG